MVVLDRFIHHKSGQITHRRMLISRPINLMIYWFGLLLFVFAGFNQAMGGTLISFVLLALVVAGFLFAYLLRKPRWGLYLATASLMFESQGIPGPINLSPPNLLLILTLAATLLRWWHYRNQRDGVQLTRVDKTSLLLGIGLLFVAFLTLFVAQFPAVVLRLMVTIIGGLVILILVQVLVTDLSGIIQLIKSYVFGATICALLGIVQSFLAGLLGVSFGIMYFLVGTTPLILPRVTSTWLDPNVFGLYLLPAVPFTWGVVNKRWAKYLILVTLLLGIAVTYSRSTWVGLTVAVWMVVGMYWIRLRSDQRANTPASASRAYLFALVTVGLVLTILQMGIGERLVSMNEPAFEGRIAMSVIGWEYFVDSPLLGVGPGNFKRVSGVFTHNSYLGVFIEYGLAGGLIWIVFLARVAWRSLRLVLQVATSEIWKMSLVALGALAGLLVGGLGIEIQNDKFFWLIMAIILTAYTQFSVAIQSNLSDPEGTSCLVRRSK